MKKFNPNSIKMLELIDIFENRYLLKGLELYVNKFNFITITQTDRVLYKNGKINWHEVKNITLSQEQKTFFVTDSDGNEITHDVINITESGKWFISITELFALLSNFEKKIERYLNIYLKNKNHNYLKLKQLVDSLSIKMKPVYLAAKYIKDEHVPILNLLNPDLISMLENTETIPNFDASDVKLPFDSFLLKFIRNDAVVELWINKSMLDNEVIISGLGCSLDPHNNTYSMKIIPIAGDFTIVHDSEIDKQTQELKFFLEKLMYFFSMEKTVEYINKSVSQKTSKNYQKTLSEQRSGTTIISLFKDIKYVYQKHESYGGTKIAHIVRGHFRKQPYGSRDCPDYKVIWIKPYVTTGEINNNKHYSLNP